MWLITCGFEEEKGSVAKMIKIINKISLNNLDMNYDRNEFKNTFYTVCYINISFMGIILETIHLNG